MHHQVPCNLWESAKCAYVHMCIQANVLVNQSILEEKKEGRDEFFRANFVLPHTVLYMYSTHNPIFFTNSSHSGTPTPFFSLPPFERKFRTKIVHTALPLNNNWLLSLFLFFEEIVSKKKERKEFFLI